jgi:hypothetical protein
MRTVRPRTRGSAPYRRRHSPSLSTTVNSRASRAVMGRPRSARTPSTRGTSPQSCAPWTCSGVSAPAASGARVNRLNAYAIDASKARTCRAQSA